MLDSNYTKNNIPVKVVKQLFTDFRNLNENSRLCLDVLEYDDGARIAVLSKKGKGNRNLNASLHLSYSGVQLLKEFLSGIDFERLETIMKKRDIEA